MQIDNILILIDTNFTNTEKNTIKLAKIIKKNKEYPTSTYFLKFNNAQIKLNSNRIILIKKCHIREIFLIIDHITDFTSFRRIIRKKLSLKK